jgi:hypothetical protein
MSSAIRTATGELAERLAIMHAAWAAAERELCEKLLPDGAETALFDEDGVIVAMEDGTLWHAPAAARRAAA